MRPRIDDFLIVIVPRKHEVIAVEQKMNEYNVPIPIASERRPARDARLFQKLADWTCKHAVNYSIGVPCALVQLDV